MKIKKFPISKVFTDLILPPLPTSILCCISIYILFRDKIDLNKMREYFFVSFIIGMVLQTGSYIIVFPIFIFVVLVELKNNKNTGNVIEILVTIFTIYFTSIMVKAFIGADFYGSNSFILKNYLIEYGVVLISVFVIVKGREVYFHKRGSEKKSLFAKNRGKIIWVMSIPIILSIWLAYHYVESMDYRTFSFIVDWYIPIVVPIFSIVFILVIIYNYEKSLKAQVDLKREIEERHEIEEYAYMVEEMYGQTRRFKHDYINMLTPLKEYIDNEDVKGLKKFFYDNVMHMDENINWNNSNIDKLKYIKNSALKAVLSAKLIKALSMNVEIKVEIVEDISKVSMNIMDLCRIVGILMDNAIEAAVECDTPKLYFCILNKKDYVIAALHNNFYGEKPVIHKIYKEGFSTKGSGRGLGLYIVKNMLDTKYDNVFINTSIKGDMFIQELWIKNPEVVLFFR